MTAGPAEPRLRRLLVWGAVCVVGGVALDATGLCPMVKSLWTPSWVLFSGGVCFVLVAIWHWLVELRGHRGATSALIVVGANPLAAYLLFHLYSAFSWGALRRLFGEAPFMVFGPAYQPFLYGLSVMVLLWLCVYVLDRLGWHLRV